MTSMPWERCLRSVKILFVASGRLQYTAAGSKPNMSKVQIKNSAFEGVPVLWIFWIFLFQRCRQCAKSDRRFPRLVAIFFACQFWRFCGLPCNAITAVSTNFDQAFNTWICTFIQHMDLYCVLELRVFRNWLMMGLRRTIYEDLWLS